MIEQEAKNFDKPIRPARTVYAIAKGKKEKQ